MSSISYKIEKLLEAKGLTKSKFAVKLGVNRDTVYNLTDESIKVSTLLKASEILDVPITHFFEKQIKKYQIPGAGMSVKEEKLDYKKTESCQELRDLVEVLKEQNTTNLTIINALTTTIEALNEQLTANKPAKSDKT